MSERDEKRKLCEMTHHEWREEYYGYKCETCGDFIPYGCEPWLPVEDDDEDADYHPYDCTRESCLQNHPERDILYGDGDYFDWGEESDDDPESEVTE